MWTKRFDRQVQNPAGILVFKTELFEAALDFREIQNVFEKPSQPVTFPLNDAEIMSRIVLFQTNGGFAIELHLHQFRQHSDRGQRRAQLVRDVGDETGFYVRELRLPPRAPNEKVSAQQNAE